MELATIEVPQQVARERFLQYRNQLRTERDEIRRAEDEQIMRAYRAAAKGARLIQLTEVLRAGGTIDVPGRTRTWSDDLRRDVVTSTTALVPRLAVARADVEKVWTNGIDREGGVRFDYVRDRWSATRSNQRHWSIATGTFPINEHPSWSTPKVVAMAPNVPPALRPRHHLRNYVVLWEAEWAQEPVPPVDPALLQHVGGDLYAVLAVWDLSPLEQAVLAGTRA